MATTYDQTKDPYFQGGEGTPNRNAVAVTPSDTIDFVKYPKNVMFGTNANASVLPLKSADGQYVQINAPQAGYVIPFRVRRVNATGTTATLYALDD